MPYVEPTVKITLSWDGVTKRWLLQWQARISDRAVTQRRRWLEVQEPLDQINANRLADAITSEMQSWLPLSDG